MNGSVIIMYSGSRGVPGSRDFPHDWRALWLTGHLGAIWGMPHWPLGAQSTQGTGAVPGWFPLSPLSSHYAASAWGNLQRAILTKTFLSSLRSEWNLLPLGATWSPGGADSVLDSRGWVLWSMQWASGVVMELGTILALHLLFLWAPRGM